MNFKDKSIAVTGGSSGIGEAAARMLAQRGAQVFALSRRAQTGVKTVCGQGSITQVRCDVTDQASVERAFEYIFSVCGSLYGLINCAGTGIAGAAEDTSDLELHEQMDCNFYGVLRAVRAVLPEMRRQERGYIINVGSVGGVFGLPFQGMYSASKFALEGFTEALRNEVRPFGIKVCIIEPGDVRTGFTGSRRYTRGTMENDAYRRAFSGAVHSMSVSEQKGMPPEKAARLIIKGLVKKEPPVRMVAGSGYKILCFVRRFLPDRLISWALFKMYCTRKTISSDIWDFKRNVLDK